VALPRHCLNTIDQPPALEPRHALSSCAKSPSLRPLAGSRKRLAPLDLLTILLLASLAATLPAEEIPSLPDAPSSLGTAESPAAPAPAQATGSISGTVLDISEAAVAGARVTLADASGAPSGVPEQVVTAGPNGEFTFTSLPPGTFKITIVSPGLETFVSNSITLGPGQSHVLPRIALPLATANTSVDVVVTQQELATEQVQAAIKQRTFGIFPNFYTSYIWNAAPLTPKLKFQLALRATTDPVTFLSTGIRAGAEQANNTYPAYGQGAQGYAKRFGAAYANSVTGRFIGGAILPSLLHQDPRYFYRGSGTLGSRALYAITAAFICRGDNGRWQPNYSHVGGNFAASAISNLYYPSSDRGFGLVLRGGLINLGANAGSNLFRELISRQFTSNVPDYEKGK